MSKVAERKTMIPPQSRGRRRRAGVGAMLLATLASACSQAPAYHTPTLAPVPAAFREAGPWVPAVPAAAGSGEWWKGFGDPQLDSLEARIETANPTLAAALARHDQSLAYVRELRAGLLPSVGVGGALTANRQSNTRPLRGRNQPDLFGAHTVDGEIGWEPDLWGEVRNQVAAGRADALATADDAAAIRLDLEAQLARDYVTLRGLDRQAAVLKSAVSDFTAADAVTRHRFADGIANGIDVGRSGSLL
ncbi:MAG: TolC family protein, partial [Sphingomonadales bacterium]|nr:TolC family protein [Sphingomonadales bacterium]